MYFPLFVDITESEFLVVGSGKVAKRKLATIKKFTDRITVVTADESFADDVARVICKPYTVSDLEGMDYVIAATDSEETNLAIASDSKAKAIPCDVSVHPEEGDFLFPGVVKRGCVTVGVSTDGKSPAVARYVRELIEEMLPDCLDVVAEKAAEYRGIIAEATSDMKKRQEINRKVVARLVETGGDAPIEDIQKIIAEELE